jgi:V8-like Glu-specific endopeptidase
MPITFSHRIVAVAAGAAIAIGVQFLALQPGAGAGRHSTAAILRDDTSSAAQSATVRYWTPARMAAALQDAQQPKKIKRALLRHLVKQPAAPATGGSTADLASSTKPHQPSAAPDTGGQGVRWTRGGTVAGAVGKVFFTLDGEDYVCSGTLVGGRESDTVLTAAHCATSGSTAGGDVDWATNWLFVPGYHDGQMPYGEYAARKFFVTKGWTGPSGGSEQYDVAFVRIATGTLSGKTARPPSLPISFADGQDTAPASSAYVFGYPSLAPFVGLYPDYCAGPVGATSGSVRIDCAMTAGDSGGPWVAGLNPATGNGTVIGVSTYKLSSNLSMLYGAVLGPAARALYAQAAGLSTPSVPLG